MSKNIAVYGAGWQAAQAALTLADLGIEVDLLVPKSVLDSDSGPQNGSNPWPLLLRAAIHPRIHILTNCVITALSGEAGAYTLRYSRTPRFVKEQLCTACGECEKVCSVRIDDRTAIHKPVLNLKSVPSSYVIEKDGISPCRGGCPLEINVHGYVALIRQGKAEKALQLIHEKAPLAGVLGRLCTHPCESQCSRQKLDKALYIQALHRYAADNGGQNPVYTPKSGPLQPEKIAIIGAGPAGLTAAWELARRGYRPTIFEANAMAGGMLATGIPAFRLPEEVRRREIAAIEKLGVEIKTGIVFGRDISLDSLSREGYQAVFLAIGAHSNNRLNIPGENLEGVVDCIAWLHQFNSHQDGQVNQKIVVIGGGNSAVDSARSAKRLSRQDVRILCLTAEMTAVPEETEEAVKEGIPIDYNHSALEILGENGRVSGVRVIKVRNVQFDAEGRISLERIEGSEYVVPADKVIVAIGQRPEAARLNIPDLKIARNSTIVSDPLTLETNLPGVLAGGDAATGSKNVVSAMAAGLRAAESIDRLMQGVPLKEGRTLEALRTVEIDVAQKQAAKQARAKMPSLSLAKRKSGDSETNLGFSPDLADKESARCLDCAGCCECLECEKACDVKAVNHADKVSESEINVAGLINLVEADLAQPPDRGLYYADSVELATPSEQLERLTALAFKVARELKLAPAERAQAAMSNALLKANGTTAGLSVFLCACGDANSTILDFNQLEAAAAVLPGVAGVHRILQSCTPEGAAEIKAALVRDRAQQAVLAACRCCGWDQVCFSCSDRQVMCRQNLNLALPSEASVEYVNIREMCAWLYRDDPAGATRNALQLITAGVRQARQIRVPAAGCGAASQRALIISGSLAGLSAAAGLSGLGWGVTLISSLDELYLKGLPPGSQAAADEYLKKLNGPGEDMQPWPQSLVLNGTPGRYEEVVKNGGQTQTIEAGVVIVDLAAIPLKQLNWLADSHLLGMIIRRRHTDYKDPAQDIKRMYQYSIGETAGMIFLGLSRENDWSRQISAGEAAAARAAVILARDAHLPRGSAVIINRNLCRGCGDCAAVCSLIEVKAAAQGLCCAEVDPAICLGCGACVGVCPTGAIKQPAQSEADIEASLEAVLRGGANQ
jgi:NADPH-dependent glutamate synthase beta subunit-like oxidoreductase/NAD-dependent dihydropyrimidine dehydrogenase PreA subunit